MTRPRDMGMHHPGRGRMGAVLIAAGALAWQGLLPAAAPAQSTAAPPAVDQVASVTLAHGVKSASLFGSGLLTPVDPATTFLNTDLPYAIIRIHALAPNTTVTLRLADPSGVAYAVEAKIPPHRGNPKSFDFAAPLYILGTDFEGDTGTWHLRVLINGGQVSDTAFQWQSATAAALPAIKAAVDSDPTNADLHWRYGAALALLGRPGDAVAELQNAIRLDSRYALYYITLGRVYERENRPADAVQQFQKALTLRGSYYDAVFAAWAHDHLQKLQGHS